MRYLCLNVITWINSEKKGEVSSEKKGFSYKYLCWVGQIGNCITSNSLVFHWYFTSASLLSPKLITLSKHGGNPKDFHSGKTVGFTPPNRLSIP